MDHRFLLNSAEGLIAECIFV